MISIYSKTTIECTTLIIYTRELIKYMYLQQDIYLQFGDHASNLKNSYSYVKLMRIKMLVCI